MKTCSIQFAGRNDTLDPRLKTRNSVNLTHMLKYCENKTECRRVQLLKEFGESFDGAECQNRPATACDICAHRVGLEFKVMKEYVELTYWVLILQDSLTYEWTAVTAQCKQLLSAISFLNTGEKEPLSFAKSAEQGRFTLLHFADVFRGQTSKKTIEHSKCLI
jgi:hypothetical protein